MVGVVARRAQSWLGTLVEITACGESPAHTQAAIGRVFARIAKIHHRFSFHSPASELSRINRAAPAGWMEVSSEMSDVLRSALDIAAASDGLFDPTVAALLIRAGRLPGSCDETAGVRSGCWDAIELRGDAVRFSCPLLVDLSGIAKGYAVDVALNQLRRERGLTAAVVNAGGDLASFGDTPVPVCLRHPKVPTASVHLVDLRDGAVATSGTYFERPLGSDASQSSLRHPKTGAALCLRESVTVLAPQCILADALTKVVAADPSAAVPILRRYEAQALRLSVVADELRISVSDDTGWTDTVGVEAACDAN